MHKIWVNGPVSPQASLRTGRKQRKKVTPECEKYHKEYAVERNEDVRQALDILTKFTSTQCCGKCISCREGTRQMQLIIESSETEDLTPAELSLIRELVTLIDHTARCGLGKRVARQAFSWLEHHGSTAPEVHKYLEAPYQELLFFRISPKLCRGCSKCSRFCPVGAITGKLKEPFHIDQNVCIKCGTCLAGCKFNAISIQD